MQCIQIPDPRSLPWPVPRWSALSLDGVDVAEVPSANWGWSKINHRNWHVYGILMIGLLVAFLRGNHVGHVEDLWVIGFALLGRLLPGARLVGPPARLAQVGDSAAS